MTTNENCAVCCNEPLVAVMVTGYVPVGVLEVEVTVTVVLPEPVTEVGLKLAVAPVGRPVAAKLTAPLKPLRAVTVAV